MKTADRKPFDPTDDSWAGTLEDAKTSLKLIKGVEEHPDKLPAINDLIDGQSMALPMSVVRAGGGALAGAAGGNILARLMTEKIRPNMSEGEASKIRHKRYVGSGLGAVVGALLASRKDMEGSDTLAQLRSEERDFGPVIDDTKDKKDTKDKP